MDSTAIRLGQRVVCPDDSVGTVLALFHHSPPRAVIRLEPSGEEEVELPVTELRPLADNPDDFRLRPSE